MTPATLKGQLAEDAEALAAGVAAVLRTPEYRRILWRYEDVLRVIDSTDHRVNPLPPVPRLDGPVPFGLLARVMHLIAGLDYATVLTSAPGGDPEYSGIAMYTSKLVGINIDRPELQQVKTGLHEAAHVMLHQPGTPLHAQDLPRRLHELQAEVTAWMTLRRLGIDSSARSFPYIAKYGAVRIGSNLLVQPAIEKAVMTVAGTVRWMAAGLTIGALV